ncbi:hypothetical protein ADU90_10285 [Clostridium botulinum]|uniref:Uncharacterized protein n=1 Tax=Clostridium botulinum C/D str. DC5 TaxID=1443128 RepID=A0A0A0IGE7_CLOBO|nr:hypothetical protein [Clostridium botulinum]KEI00920.1 hypothetical protein Z952_13135 [Clostridium botulinum C/D str. BKT75002]KEI11086.1 hypothetical protein Z954_08995 [Clostridium botulinum C/D str. BKT2873]KGM94099.1 hypothetical protein Z956_09285 [Clostridium botulinum D str. CCUG 7971]KGN00058.1 hypothetical protein Z955_04865 [Clostridium botulinum C/D str. DC5]KOC50590.1 hypothetical protein ADU88_02030 [Clostridium botulinum]
MFKRLSTFLFLLIISITTTAFAGNIPESIMMNPQKGLFIGKIIDTSDKKFTIEPITVMMGNIKDKQIKIKKFDKYYGTNTTPKKNDYIVARLTDVNKIDEFWIFKTTSSDYKTLKLICNPTYDMILRYQKYINNGDYFKAQKNLDDKLTLKKNSNKTNKNLDKTKETIALQTKNKISKKQYILLSILILSMAGMCIYSYINRKKH